MMTSHRITPGQLLPDVGGLYRHRETGRLATVWGSGTGVRVRRQGDRGQGTWMTVEELYWDYIHADAGAAG